MFYVMLSVLPLVGSISETDVERNETTRNVPSDENKSSSEDKFRGRWRAGENLMFEVFKKDVRKKVEDEI